jgi:hypothetical protein
MGRGRLELREDQAAALEGFEDSELRHTLRVKDIIHNPTLFQSLVGLCFVSPAQSPAPLLSRIMYVIPPLSSDSTCYRSGSAILSCPKMNKNTWRVKL